MLRREDSGFTLLELLIAITLLTGGLLASVASAALVSRLIGHGRQAERVAAFAARRLERLRVTACASGPSQGTEQLRLGNGWLATNDWTMTRGPATTVRILVITRFATRPGTARSDSIESAVVC